ncbi:MAG: UDP-N-acetylglucosamine 2-epimerase (non-hydrolyzing), partial [Alphaproteobacteria bacterium]|nr:UDP-N-acetylglucosamine 2-epimerase (non-hydrolyzing) [Alphaproteobacteria bacterium]
MKPVLTILGTRPEAIKLAPVVHRLREHADLEPVVCFTGQHAPEMVDGILDLFAVRADIRLAALRHGQSLAQLTSALIAEISPVYERIRPRAVLVQGDTTTCFVGALTAFYRRIPVAHVEGGLRTNDLSAPWPEEGNRQMVTRLCDLHFAPTKRAAEALYRENIRPDRVVVTGNTVIDALLRVVSLNAADGIDALSALKPDRDARRRYLLVTLHRREVFGDAIRNMLAALADIAGRHPELDIVLLNHTNPEVRAAIADTIAADLANLWVMPRRHY